MILFYQRYPNDVVVIFHRLGEQCDFDLCKYMLLLIWRYDKKGSVIVIIINYAVGGSVEGTRSHPSAIL